LLETDVQALANASELLVVVAIILFGCFTLEVYHLFIAPDIELGFNRLTVIVGFLVVTHYYFKTRSLRCNLFAFFRTRRGNLERVDERA
jgi:hypothetical protein